ncbi:MAG: RHS repeat-associated core domain-containing protein [Coriobacteriia bacterium]|nr:RHS repeat-associated core domain-containing protein [Coriobacteriia bacterium]
MSATPVAFFIATTARGDVAELLDSSGAPFALYSYDAYGSPGQVLSAATARISAPLAEAIARANALRYAGYAYDAHSGLYYLSKRCYDPATAQFLTKDPAKADGEESAYQYCAGDPVGKVDPSGEAWVWVAYHFVTERDAHWRDAGLALGTVLKWGAEALFMYLSGGTSLIARLPRGIRYAYQALSLASNWSDVRNAITHRWKQRDLLVLLRDSHARWSPSCHSARWFVVSFAWQLQRKVQGRYRIVDEWYAGFVRCDVYDSRTGRPAAGRGPHFLGWPRRVLAW